MGGFVIQYAVGIGAALAWFGSWIVALHSCGIAFFFTGTPEERTRKRERILKMGKWRYVLLFGVLGWGIALGLGSSIAYVAAHGFNGGEVAIRAVIWAVFGLLYSVRMWNDSFRGEVPFPPPFLSQK